MAKYCVYCGRSSSKENPVEGNICLNCLLKRGEAVRLSKETISIPLCKTCYSIRIGFKWVNTTGFENAIDYVVKNYLLHYIEAAPNITDLRIIDYEFETSSSWRTLVKVYVAGRFGGKEFTVPVNVVLMFKPVKCPRCIMYDSREFDAVIQIRGFDKNTLVRLIDALLSRDVKTARDLIDLVELDNGIDLYFYRAGSARRLARKLAQKLKASTIESYEEAGMRSGRKRTRLYISLKPFKKT